MNDDGNRVEELEDELEQEKIRTKLYVDKIKQLVQEKNEITDEYNRMVEENENLKQRGDSLATKSHLTQNSDIQEELKKNIIKKDQ